MLTIEPGKQIVYQTGPKVRVIEEEPTQLEIVNAQHVGILVNNFSKEEAKAACSALYEKYPGIYADTMFRSDIKKRAKLQAIDALLKE